MDSKSDDRVSGFFQPRADEAALWTLVSGVGQFVLAGWCLAFASFSLLIGLAQLLTSGGLPDWANGLFAAFFIGVGAVLLIVGLRFLARSVHSLWVAWRKIWFRINYYRRPDAIRALQAAEGDPVLEPYVRHLLKHGVFHLDDLPSTSS